MLTHEERSDVDAPVEDEEVSLDGRAGIEDHTFPSRKGFERGSFHGRLVA